MQSELPGGTKWAASQSGGLSSDARAMMLFEANKKTAVVAYLLWFFLGLLSLLVVAVSIAGLYMALQLFRTPGRSPRPRP